MKIFKKILLLNCIFLSIISFAQQPKKTAKERAEQETAWIKQNFSLTPDKVTDVYNILLHHLQSVDEIVAVHPKTDSVSQAKLKAAGAEKNEALQKVLTAAQFQMYVAHRAQLKENAAQRTQK